MSIPPSPSSDPDQTHVVPRAKSQAFGRFTLLRVLGEGSMGVIWQARDEKLERNVALKFLRDSVRQDPEAVSDLKKVVRRCLELTHPHIVRIYDLVEDESAMAISMEYVPGRNLAALQALRPSSRFDPVDLAPLVPQLCGALDYAHTQANVVHRDVNPRNLLVTDNGILKIAGFGISRSLQETQARQTGDLRSVADALAYMSPQQREGQMPKPADDIYAVGVTLYDLLTGAPPFSVDDLLKLGQPPAPPPPSARRAESGGTAAALSPAWDETIMACLQRPVPQRPAGIMEVARRLAATEPASVPSTHPWDSPAVAAVTTQELPASLAPPTGPMVTSSSSVATLRQYWVQLSVGLAVMLGLAVLAGWFFGIYEPEHKRQLEIARREAEVRTAAVAEEKARRNQEAIQLKKEHDEAEARRKEEDENRAREAERLAKARGSLAIRTDPSGAEVQIGPEPDYLAVTTSPVNLKQVKLGKYPLHIHLDDYEDYTGEVEVKENAQADPGLIKLVRSTGKIQVASTPPGLAYRIQGDQAGPVALNGQTPSTVDNLPTGRYRVSVRRPGWAEPVENTVEVKRGATAAVLAEFIGGNVELESVPAGAVVLQAGREVGTTPWRVEVPPGSFAFELRLPGFRTARVTGAARSGEDQTLSSTLVRATGGIKPRVLVAGQEASVAGMTYAIDGHDVSLVDGVLTEVPSGERQLEARHPDYESGTAAVSVKADEITPVDVALVPKPAELIFDVSGPADYAVSVNGLTAILTEHRLKVPSGQELSVVITAAGYKTAQRTVTLPANVVQTLAVALEPEADAPSGAAPAAPLPSTAPDNSPESKTVAPEQSPAAPESKADSPAPQAAAAAAESAPAAPAPPVGRAHVISDLGLELLPVAAGTFTMGSATDEADRDPDEGPQTMVALSRPFWLGKYEITQGQWQAIMDRNPSRNQKLGGPVEQVSWEEAMEFCRRLTARERAAGRLPAKCSFTLPTEAQWEYACRAGTTGPFAGDLNLMGWYDQNSRRSSHAITDRISVVSAAGALDSGPAHWVPNLQERQPNAWGLYDMHGNVAEWCLDHYGSYSGGSVADPGGPFMGADRVFRGGAWDLPAKYARSASRERANPAEHRADVGFRLAMVLAP